MELGLFTQPDRPLSNGIYLGGEINDGVFSISNLSAFIYVGLNPIIFTDPSGWARVHYIFVQVSNSGISEGKPHTTYFTKHALVRQEKLQEMNNSDNCVNIHFYETGEDIVNTINLTAPVDEIATMDVYGHSTSSGIFGRNPNETGLYKNSEEDVNREQGGRKVSDIDFSKFSEDTQITLAGCYADSITDSVASDIANELAMEKKKDATVYARSVKTEMIHTENHDRNWNKYDVKNQCLPEEEEDLQAIRVRGENGATHPDEIYANVDERAEKAKDAKNKSPVEN